MSITDIILGKWPEKMEIVIMVGLIIFLVTRYYDYIMF